MEHPPQIPISAELPEDEKSEMRHDGNSQQIPKIELTREGKEKETTRPKRPSKVFRPRATSCTTTKPTEERVDPLGNSTETCEARKRAISVNPTGRKRTLSRTTPVIRARGLSVSLPAPPQPPPHSLQPRAISETPRHVSFPILSLALCFITGIILPAFT